MRRVLAKGTPLSEFRQEVDGKTFRNPDTGNEVLFQGLPRPEQARIFSEWRRRQRGDEPRKERERGLIEIDKEDARERAKHIAETAKRWQVRDPDERIGDRFTPGMGRGYVTMGTLNLTDVRGRKFERPLRLALGERNPELWKAGRKYTTGGRVVTRQTGEDDPGTPMYVQVELNPDRMYAEMAEAGRKLEDEIYSILIHEITHARDVLMTQRELKKHRKKHETPEDTPPALRTEAENREYYNKPTEVRAFKRQVAEEVRRELEKRHRVHDFKKDLAEKKREKGEDVDFDDDPDWIDMDAEAVMGLLDKSITWDRVRHYLTPKNRRRFLESVASVVRKFKEDRGGKVAAHRIVAAWFRRAVSQKYLDKLLGKVDTDDPPFDHLFSGNRKMVVDPEKYGGLGVAEPDNSEKLETFLRDNGVLAEGDTIDWRKGLLLDSKGKIKSKVGKAMQKAIKKFVGDDRDFFTNLTKMRRGVAQGETPLQLTLGVGRDNLQALVGMGHLLSEDFPTDEIWRELETFGSPSPWSWKKLKEVADKFADLSPDERREKMDEHKHKYKEIKVSEDYRRQYWAARGLFQTHNKAKRGDEADWMLNHFRKWADRTDEMYGSADGDAVRKVHEFGAKMEPERLEQILGLAEIEKQQQAYDLWRSIRGEDLAIVLSRDPVDVLRMSDHPKAVQAIQSCHSEGGSEFQCAIEEAEEGGMIAYVVKKSDVDGRDLEEGELFEDQGRGIKGIKPFARLRLRRFENDASSGGLEIAVPETTTYGADFPDFVQAITNWAREEQPEFVDGDAGYSKRPRDWRLTGGTYQDSESSELFNNFFDRDESDNYSDEPSEDEYDPYGEGYTVDDSPYYDPDGEDEDEGEAEVSEKSVEPWRDTDRMTDFWTWMKDNHPRIPNPNRRGTKKDISPATLRGYARGRAGYSSAARELVNRYLARYRDERQQYAEGSARGDIRAAKVASEWLRRVAKQLTFEEWVKGRRFKNPQTGNMILFKSLKQPEQEKIRAQWGQQERFERTEPRRKVEHSEEHGRVIDTRPEDDVERQRKIEDESKALWEKALQLRRSKKTSFERNMFRKEGGQKLSRYILDNALPDDEAALQILATQDVGSEGVIARGVKALTTDQVSEMFGFRPDEDRSAVVEFKDGRWVRPGHHDASSWTGNAEIAAEFSQPMGEEAGGWDVVMVADTDDDNNGHFVTIDYDNLLENEHEASEDKLYERAFERLVEQAKKKGKTAEDSVFLRVEDADDIRHFDPDELDEKELREYQDALEDLNEHYHYAAEDLSLEGSFADASTCSREEEHLAVGPVKLARVYVFPSGSDADAREHVLGRLGEEMYEGEFDEESGAMRMAAESRGRPRPRKGPKKPPRVDRFNVSAEDVFAEDQAKRTARRWLLRAATPRTT